MMRRFAFAAGVLCLAGIAFTTLAAETRPHLFPFPSIDRLFAFVVAGFLLGIAFPRHLVVILACLVIGAIGLELLQFLRPTRDPRFFDAVVKVLGSCVGIAAAKGVDAILIKRSANRQR